MWSCSTKGQVSLVIWKRTEDGESAEEKVGTERREDMRWPGAEVREVTGKCNMRHTNLATYLSNNIAITIAKAEIKILYVPIIY